MKIKKSTEQLLVESFKEEIKLLEYENKLLKNENKK